MTNLYKITISRISTRRTCSHTDRHVVAPCLDEAIKRACHLADIAHPGALITIEAAHIYDHDTDTWMRLALHDNADN